MSAAGVLAGRRVLVVEDQYLVAAEMRRMLNALGAVVLGPVNDTRSALAHVNADDPPDFAVLDVNLDEGRVYPVAEALRARGAPFLFATGYDAWALDPRFLDAPLVTKPVSPAALAAAVARLDLRKGPA